MAIGDRLIGWSKRWDLFGRQVICAQCMMAQDVDEAKKPFSHDPHCAKSCHPDQQPWRELAEILGAFPELISGA